MKICTVVGARPQFIKAAALSRVLRKTQTEILIHTGQHFDANMSDVFFTELGIPNPDYNLGISGGSHAQMTARMLSAIEEVLLKEKPDAVLLYGDTNSTLAAALAAVKLHMPVIHVEAGNRLGALSNPEEVNRICTDHVSSLKFACTESALDFLKREGIADNSYLVGDPMYDAFLYYTGRGAATVFTTLDNRSITAPREYYYLTCHRQENTDDDSKLRSILAAMNTLDAPTIYPVHPRNRDTALALEKSGAFPNVVFIQAVGYLESISLVKGAKKIVTDSGGVQREAFFAGVQCVTVLDYVCWPETMTGNCNQLAKPDCADILQRLSAKMTIPQNYAPFGDGCACGKICDIIDKTFK